MDGSERITGKPIDLVYPTQRELARLLREIFNEQAAYSVDVERAERVERAVKNFLDGRFIRLHQNGERSLD